MARQPSSGFDLPSVESVDRSPMRSPGSSGNLSQKKVYNPADTKKSLISVGKSVVDSNAYSIYSSPVPEKGERKKEKQKILAKLQQLQKIQKFNEEKLMKDLQQLEKKNQNIVNSNKNGKVNMNRKKIGTTPPLSAEKKPGVNYEDRIKELEAKLFGK